MRLVDDSELEYYGVWQHEAKAVGLKSLDSSSWTFVKFLFACHGGLGNGSKSIPIE